MKKDSVFLSKTLISGADIGYDHLLAIFELAGKEE
jgi:hypothetical protein